MQPTLLILRQPRALRALRAPHLQLKSTICFTAARFLAATSSGRRSMASSSSPGRDRDWQPPIEPLRPPLPYTQGHSLRVQRVKPLPPFAHMYWDHTSDDLKQFITHFRSIKDDELKSTTQTDFCRSRPPLPCENLDEVASLDIVGNISSGDNRRAQVILCKNDSIAREPFVAKIYDPLYRRFEHSDFDGIPVDPVISADHDFTCEASAYEELDPRLGGGLIPKYYGSWKLELPLDGRMRTVFLVLMEHITWIPLLMFDPTRYPIDVRLNLVAKVMEADVAMSFAGVRHDDLAPRNIFCNRTDLGSPDLKVRVVDLNIAKINRYLGRAIPCRTQGLPVSPIITYKTRRIDDLGDWQNYYWSDDVGHMAWMKSRWGGSEAYQPVTEEDMICT